MKTMGFEVFLSKIKSKKLIAIILVIFALVYASISLGNHYLFRTFALDLGMFTQAVYSYSQFKPALFTLGIAGNDMSFLAAHFSIITIFYAPFSYIFGSYTLLIIQIAAILFGGYFSYRISLNYFSKTSIVPYLILIQFFSIWGIYSALSFDFHNNVVGAMLVPALVYYIEKRNLFLSFLFMLLILFTKEIMALWMIFILLGLMLKNRKAFYKSYYRFEIPMLVFSVIYAVTVIFYIMPSLQGEVQNLQLTRYNHLGGSMLEIAMNFIKHPKFLFETLFYNTLDHPLFDYIKTETYILFLLAGGIFCLFQPSYFIMVIPIFCLKFFSNDYGFWGINGQYSIEFVPIISLATIGIFRHIKKHQVLIMVILLLLTIASNIKSIESRQMPWYDSQNTKFYGKAHYQTELNLKEVYDALKLIDKSSPVSASSSIVPHIAMRNKIYHFPIVKDAVYIALFKTKDYWPVAKDDLMLEIQKLKDGPEYTGIFESVDLIIFKKTTG